MQKEGGKSNRIDLKYVEVDFEGVVHQKARIVQQNLLLNSVLRNADYGADCTYIKSDEYQMYSVDLRNFDTLREMLLTHAGLDTRVPTLFLSEMVLIYLDPEYSRNIIRWCAQEFGVNMFVVYEQIKPHDPFGRTMVANLQERQCPLRSIFEYPTVESQKKRFIDLGYERCSALDMNAIYSRIVDQQERSRIERLEIFDEFEEWYMIMDHYCIVVAINELSNGSNQDQKRPNALSDEEWEQVQKLSDQWRIKWNLT